MIVKVKVYSGISLADHVNVVRFTPMIHVTSLSMTSDSLTLIRIVMPSEIAISFMLPIDLGRCSSGPHPLNAAFSYLLLWNKSFDDARLFDFD